MTISSHLESWWTSTPYHHQWHHCSSAGSADEDVPSLPVTERERERERGREGEREKLSSPPLEQATRVQEDSRGTLSSEYGTHKTAKARFWPRLSKKKQNISSCSRAKVCRTSRLVARGCTEGKCSIVTVRWMRCGEAAASDLESKPSLPNSPLLSALGALRNFLWHTLETTLGVRRNSSWALRSLRPALPAQFCGSRQTLRRRPALGAHCRRGANSWLPKQSLRAGGGASRPHWLRKFWLPSIHNPLLRPFSPHLHHFDISGPLQGALKVLIYVCYDLYDAE